MNKFDGVANTLFVPLVARINISKKFPEYFMDEKALELEKYLPQGADKGSSEYSNMASVARYYNMDKTVTAFAKSYAESNIVYLGAGLETAYDRLSDKIENRTVHWYEADLPEVIEARKKVFGQRKNETLIAGDMFKLEWVKEIDNSLPTLLIVSGVFQYFHEEEIIAFIKGCGKAFPKGEMLFDATSESGLKFTNWFIKRTGNASAIMYFGINDSKEFANKCSMELLEEKTFFPEALKMLGKKLSFVTKVSMKVAEKKKQVKKAEQTQVVEEIGGDYAAIAKVEKTFGIAPKATDVGLKRAKALKNRIVATSYIMSGEFSRGDAVTVSFDGADMTTTILDVIECSSSSTFETALNATFGKHKAKEGVSAWIILDVMGGVGKGALIKK